ncbi:VOC family protein [Cupriavidus pampae]|uniref:VOC domain-containing protein n=1 Tax=Cupriavidus pampae TaxID=659251 RepID=A0ABM8WGP5_9BURK|nr:VOC family protein [Cupriavidus pampae]CAG9166522.1 hypothetical protein LMG32289_01050 [Cupriavidus pampae]
MSENALAWTAATINHIAITVSDLNVSREWYCRMFGLTVIQQSDDSVLLGFGEGMLVLRVGDNPGTISHFMFGVRQYDEEALRQHLLDNSLDPQKDLESFHVRDPDGLNVQVGDPALGLNAGIVDNHFKMK